MNKFTKNEKSTRHKKIWLIQLVTVAITVVFVLLCFFIFFSSGRDIPDENMLVRGGLWYTKASNGWVVMNSDDILAKRLVIPNEIQGLPVIELQELGECRYVEELHLSENIRSVSAKAFQALSGLKSITVDQENRYLMSSDGILYDKPMYTLIKVPVRYIGSGVIALPDTVVNIQSEAFLKNDTITNVVLPAALLAIEEKAFADCSRLTGVEFSTQSNLRIIGDGAFFDCVRLRSFDLPDSLTSIGKGAFYGCSAIVSFKTVDNSDYYTSSGVLFSKSENSLTAYPCGKTDNRYEVPEGVKKIDKLAFSGNKSLMCLELPSSLEHFNLEALSRCYAMNTVFLRGSTPPVVESWPGFYQDIGFCVDKAALPSYLQNSIWRELNIFSAYEKADFAYITLSELEQKDEERYLLLTQLGATGDDLVVSGFWGGGVAYIPDSMTIDGIPRDIVGYMNGTFSSYTLTELSLGKNLLAIADKDFYSFELLISIKFGEGLQYIGNESFGRCTELEAVLFDYASDRDKNVIIADRAFYGCESLQEVQLPVFTNENAYVYVGEGAFDGCYELQNLFVPCKVITQFKATDADRFYFIIADELLDYYSIVDNYINWIGMDRDRIITYSEYLDRNNNTDSDEVEE